MPTTSGELARACLAGLRDAGAKFAVLHDYEQLESDQISDVDIVVGQDPRTVIRATERCGAERGLLPIILWPYDIGGTVTLFLATPDARDGVQLDMLHDPDGVGRYGVRSEILLQFVEERPIAPVVDSAARLLYLWQKRTPRARPTDSIHCAKKRQGLTSTGWRRCPGPSRARYIRLVASWGTMSGPLRNRGQSCRSSLVSRVGSDAPSEHGSMSHSMTSQASWYGVSRGIW